VDATFDRGRTLPWSWYTDPDVFRREQEQIFRGAWQYVGPAEQVARAGDYFTTFAGQVPIVVVRDREGELRAFVNVCRHRGYLVAQGAGRRETLQCGYHAWTYNLDGTLRAAPRSEVEPEFDKAELSLRTAQVDTWGPLVFVNPDPDAAGLVETLRDLPELVASAGVDVETLRFRLRAEFAVEANWKLVCENFLECYHCPVAHQGFSRLVDVTPGSYRLEPGATFSSQYGALRPNGEGAYDARGEVERSQFHFIWPNVGINIFPGRPNFSIGPILPAAPGRTERFLDYFFAADVEESWVAELLEFDGQIGREDTALVEGVQRGVGAGMLEDGRLMSGSEQLIADFQARVAAALAA
jgi:phenylpropionate dioxygenase-like ring-hydroxylating dioxygenase large terminal subunit